MVETIVSLEGEGEGEVVIITITTEEVVGAGPTTGGTDLATTPLGD